MNKIVTAFIDAHRDNLIDLLEGEKNCHRFTRPMWQLRQLAQGAKRKNKFAMAHPETMLPSAAELYEYRDLLRQMRG